MRRRVPRNRRRTPALAWLILVAVATAGRPASAADTPTAAPRALSTAATPPAAGPLSTRAVPRVAQNRAGTPPAPGPGPDSALPPALPELPPAAAPTPTSPLGPPAPGSATGLAPDTPSRPSGVSAGAAAAAAAATDPGAAGGTPATDSLDTVPGGGGATQPTAADVAPTIQQAAEKPTAAASTNSLMRALGLSNSPVQFYGWIQNSYTGNADGHPRNGVNFGVFPNHLANAWQGNQYYLIAENAIEPLVDYLNLGFRVDTLFGNDWQFTKSYGLFDRAFPTNHFAGIDLPQIYGSAHLPILTRYGMDVVGGRFYSPAGFESVQATRRPLLSVPYLFNFTPFTLFGVLTTLHLNERVNIYNGAVNGWDRWIDTNYKYSYLGGINATSRDTKTTFTFILITGPDQLPRFAPANSPFLPTGVVTNATLQGRRNPYYAGDFRTFLSSVLTHKWGGRLNEAAEVFFVHETNVQGLGPGGPRHVNNESAWYGFAHWFLYTFNDHVTGVYRAEVFRDQNGAATGVADTLYEMTVGAIIKPKTWLWFRPEARYDWAQFKKPFDDGTRGSQLTLAFDVIVLF